MLQRCPVAQRIFGFQHLSPEEVEFLRLHSSAIFEGGFRYNVPLSAAEETLSYVRKQLHKQLAKKNTKVCISVFVPKKHSTQCSHQQFQLLQDGNVITLRRSLKKLLFPTILMVYQVFWENIGLERSWKTAKQLNLIPSME